MEKIRADNNPEKSAGIALVTALVMTVVVLMLIASLTYLFTKGFQTNIINRNFSSVYEAANGGVEYATGVINTYLIGTPTDIGNIQPSTDVLEGIIKSCDTGEAMIKARTADGNYTITAAIRCAGMQGLPGYGGALRFPPPPAAAGGGTGSTEKYYIFYSIRANATETSSSENVGQTEALYRVVQ